MQTRAVVHPLHLMDTPNPVQEPETMGTTYITTVTVGIVLAVGLIEDANLVVTGQEELHCA